MKKQLGFAMLDVLLAVIVVLLAFTGIYALFDRGVASNNMTQAQNQMIEMAGVFSDLSSAGLTNDLSSGSQLAYLFQNSQRLASRYFYSTENSIGMQNSFGELVLIGDGITPYSFEAKVPLGCATEQEAERFFNAVRDEYSCVGDSDDFANCELDSTGCGNDVNTITLYYNTSG